MTRRDDTAALSSWLERRAPQWQELEERLRHQPEDRKRRTEEVMGLVYGLNGLARDLSLARRVLSDSRLTRYLQGLYLKGHEQLHRPARRLRRDAVASLRQGLPDAVARLRPTLAAVVALFLLCAGVGWLLVAEFPDLGSLFASREMIEALERGELWTDGLLNVVPSSLLAAGITTNNIVVALTAYVMGAFYGLGTLYILATNGLMLGGVFALTARYGLADRLGSFVVAHGLVELSVICMAAAAGVRLGEALVRPGDRPRSEALRGAVGETAPVVAAGVAFLVGSGVIEGYLSPDPGVPLILRVAVGVGYWLVFAAVMGGALRPRGSVPPVSDRA